MGGMFAARPDPAVVLVPGRGEPAVLARSSEEPRAVGTGHGNARILESLRADMDWYRAALAVEHDPRLWLHGHAQPDRVGLRLSVPAWAPSGPRPVDRLRPTSDGLLVVLRTMVRPRSGFRLGFSRG